MLVEHTKPCALTIGPLMLIPGFNQIDDARWDNVSKDPKWKRPIEIHIKAGTLNLQDSRKKLTVDVVEKTYDVDLLEDWLANPEHKGPLRGAIKKQLKAMEIEEIM